MIASEATEHPNSAWVEKQADLFVDQTAGRDEKPSICPAWVTRSPARASAIDWLNPFPPANRWYSEHGRVPAF
jgi:hypothetical protein